jgi:hypothetical protein
MITLVRKLFWVLLFLAFTVGFVTLFDHGYVSVNQFIADAKGEVNDFVLLVNPPKAPAKTPDQTQQ